MSVDMNMSILIVDDYKTMLRIIRNLLKQLGFNNVDEATDGSMALQKLRDKEYGLVISDWNMEPMTGIQLLREVRADAKLKALPKVGETVDVTYTRTPSGALEGANLNLSKSNIN